MALLPPQLAMAPGIAARRSADSVREIRALWVVRHTLVSPVEVRRLVERASANGITDLIVQVRGRGDAYYNSSFEPRAAGLALLPAGFDPLAQVIDEAHRAGLRVHAWLNTYLVADTGRLPDSPEHLVYRRPEWLMVPRELAVELYNLPPTSADYLERILSYSRRNRARIEGLFVSPANPAVRDHLVSLWLDIATRYEVDGLHFDYIRYPGPEFDYSRTSLKQFQAELARALPAGDRTFLGQHLEREPLTQVSTFPAEYAEFQRRQVSLLVERIYRRVKEVRPDLKVSAAVFANERDAASARFQDWRSWLERGWVDAICPMAYTADTELFERQIATAVSLASRREVWSGIGVYRQKVSAAREKIELSRRLGARGFILFSYNSLIEPAPNNPRGEYLEQLRDLIISLPNPAAERRGE